MRKLALVSAVSLALAGCGGGGDDDNSKPSKAEFTKNAEAACADIQKQAERLAENEPENVDQLVDFAEDARKTTDDAVQRIEDLETPEGADGEKAERWKEAVRKEADELRSALDAIKKAAEDDDQQALLTAVQDLQRLQGQENESDRLSKELGLTGCAN